MRLATLCFLLTAVSAPAITVTYHIEFGIPSLPDLPPAAVMRLDYTGDFPAAGSSTIYLDDARITAVDPLDYAGYPLRLAESFMLFTSSALQSIAFTFGPSAPSPDRVILTAMIPGADTPGIWTSSLATNLNIGGITGESGCQQCLQVMVTPLLEGEVVTPEPGTALLLAIPLGLALVRRYR